MVDIREFRANLRLLERKIAAGMSEQSECCGVTGAQCHVLLELEGAGCINLTSLSQRLELDKSTLSRTVDGLVLLGLVLRSTDPENRRQQIICLSESGKTKVDSINRLCDNQYQGVLDSLPADQALQLCQSLALLAGVLDLPGLPGKGDCCDCS